MPVAVLVSSMTTPFWFSIAMTPLPAPTAAPASAAA
jgi:hypothetical protein